MSKKTHDADVAFIQALAELLRENDLTELEVSRDYGEDDSLNVRVSRQTTLVQQAIAAPAPVASPVPAAAPVAAAAPAAPAAADQADASDPVNDPGAVTSPMVGTAYLAPEPGAANFINVGDQIAEGQMLTPSRPG